ncbi:MAG: hypothetical protein D6812_16710 [Deltaproteobacteria bacterium]|nr:MAG: hypothetical protein D6812_16710 [Deltaproteobacteria bacterium]
MLCIRCWNEEKGQADDLLDEIPCPACQATGRKEKALVEVAAASATDVESAGGEPRRWSEREILFSLLFSPREALLHAARDGNLWVSFLGVYLFTLVLLFMRVSRIILPSWEVLLPLCSFLLFSLVVGLFKGFVNFSIFTVLWGYLGAHALRGKTTLRENALMVGHAIFLPSVVALLLFVPLYSCMFRTQDRIYAAAEGNAGEVGPDASSPDTSGETEAEGTEAPEAKTPPLWEALRFYWHEWYENVIEYPDDTYAYALHFLTRDNPLLVPVWIFQILLILWGVGMLWLGIHTINGFTVWRSFLAVVSPISLWIILQYVLYLLRRPDPLPFGM